MNIITRGGVEFIAVLFGISLSFYLEDVRQENNLRKLNHQILERMNETINDDIKDLEENIAVHKLAISSCKWIRSSPLTDVNLDSLSYHLSVSAFATVYVPNEEEYKTIISSGQIEVIKNSLLIKAIYGKYRQHSFLRTIEKSFFTFFGDIIQPYFNEITDDVIVKSKDLPYSWAFLHYKLYQAPDRKKLRILIGQLEQMHESYIVVTKGVLKRTKLLNELLEKELLKKS